MNTDTVRTDIQAWKYNFVYICFPDNTFYLNLFHISIIWYPPDPPCPDPDDDPDVQPDKEDGGNNHCGQEGVNTLGTQQDN